MFKYIILFPLFIIWQLSLFANSKITIDPKLKKDIGQMLVIGFRGMDAKPDSKIFKTVKELNIGGVILFDYDVPTQRFIRNIQNPKQVKKLCNDLQNIATTPLLIAVDAEGGKINRLNPKYGFINIASHQEFGKNNNPNYTYTQTKILAKELQELGINTNFGPVVDLNRNPDNPVIAKKERSFSKEPHIVIEQATAFIKAHRDHNILTALKHFPGHGSSKNDTHLGLTDVTNTYDEIELKPFKELIKNNLVDLIMTSHIINKIFDKNYPVTLSSYYIPQIIRKEFHYNGVVVSDDMAMGAITEHYSFKEAIIKAINAGCDMLILSNNGKEYDAKIAYKAYNIIIQALKDKQITQEHIEQSLQRIHKLKAQL